MYYSVYSYYNGVVSDRCFDTREEALLFIKSLIKRGIPKEEISFSKWQSLNF